MRTAAVVAATLAVSAGLAGAGWQVETLPHAGISYGLYSSIAVDSRDRPHIAFYADNDGKLNYAKWTGTAWSTQAYPKNNDEGLYPSLALTTQDLARISYYHAYPAYDLKYFETDGTTWTTQIVDSAGWAGWFTSLRLDSQDRPRISYLEQTGRTLRYAAWSGTGWQILPLAVNCDVSQTSMGLNSFDQPAIAFARSNHLEVVVSNGGNWINQIVDPEASTGSGCALAVAGNGSLHVSYYAGGPEALRYASYTIASGWIISTLDTGNVGQTTAIAVDARNRPHIVYSDKGLHRLKHAWREGSAWHIEAVNEPGGGGDNPSLALDSAGCAHVSFTTDVSAYPRVLKYARQTRGDLSALLLPLLLDKPTP